MSGGGDDAGRAAVSSLARALEQVTGFDAEAVAQTSLSSNTAAASLVLLFNKYIRDDKPPKWPLYDAFEALRAHGVVAIELGWDPKFVDVRLKFMERIYGRLHDMYSFDMKEDVGFKFSAAPPNSKAHETLSKCIGHIWLLDHQDFDVEGKAIIMDDDMHEDTSEYNGGGEKHWDPSPFNLPDEAGGDGASAGLMCTTMRGSFARDHAMGGAATQTTTAVLPGNKGAGAAGGGPATRSKTGGSKAAMKAGGRKRVDPDVRIQNEIAWAQKALQTLREAKATLHAYEQSTWPLPSSPQLWAWQGLSDPFYRVVTAATPAYVAFKLESENTDAKQDRFFEQLQYGCGRKAEAGVTTAGVEQAAKVLAEDLLERFQNVPIDDISFCLLSMAGMVLKCNGTLATCETVYDCKPHIIRIVESVTADYPKKGPVMCWMYEHPRLNRRYETGEQTTTDGLPGKKAAGGAAAGGGSVPAKPASKAGKGGSKSKKETEARIDAGRRGELAVAIAARDAAERARKLSAWEQSCDSDGSEPEEHDTDCDFFGDCKECCDLGECTTKDGRADMSLDSTPGGGIKCVYCK